MPTQLFAAEGHVYQVRANGKKQLWLPLAGDDKVKVTKLGPVGVAP